MLSRQAPPIPAVGDIAIIESYVRQALQGKLLLGPYSRFGWHHPGPLYFFVLLPFYVLSGYRTAGLSAGAVAINLGAIVAFVWLARTTGRRSSTMILSTCAAAYAARFADLLASPWNPHVVVLPLMALVLATARFASGSVFLLPVVAFLSSLIVQTHIGLLPVVAAITATSLVAASRRPRFWSAAHLSAWLLAVLWCLPVVEELSTNSGNLTILWRFFMGGHAVGQSFHASFVAWAGALCGPFVPHFAVAWGGNPPEPSGPLGQACAVAETVLLAFICVRAVRRDRQFHLALPALLLIASLVSLWSITRIEGEIVDYEVFWISALGAMNIAVIFEAALAALWPRAATAIPATAANATCAACLALAVALGVFQLRANVYRPHGPENEQMAVNELSSAIEDFTRVRHVDRLLLGMDDRGWSVAAGIIVRLQKAGVPVAVGPGAVWMFGAGLAPTGNEQQTVVICSYARHDELMAQRGTVTLAGEGGFFADVVAVP